MQRLFGLPILVFGLVTLVHGIYVIRNPAWRHQGWWGRNKVWTVLFAGLPIRAKGEDKEVFERVGGWISAILGGVLAAGGLVGLLVGFR